MIGPSLKLLLEPSPECGKYAQKLTEASQKAQGDAD